MKLDKTYLEHRIANKCYAKITSLELEVTTQFKLRHGNGNLDAEQCRALVKGAIRDLLVWREISHLIYLGNKYLQNGK